MKIFSESAHHDYVWLRGKPPKDKRRIWPFSSWAGHTTPIILISDDAEYVIHESISGTIYIYEEHLLCE